MADKKVSIETALIHAGEPQPRIKGAVSLPIFQSATFEYGGQENYHDLGYIRLNNTPNHDALHAKLAAIEGGEDALVTSSGMSAITTAILTLLKAGDHLLIQDCLYGGTHDFVTKDLPGLGIEYDFVDTNDPDEWAKKLRNNTRVFYLESVANPLLTVPDCKAVVDFARHKHLTTIIDNTFPSPVNFRPLELGFDLVIHSCTKYLNGHSDIVGGACVGGAALIKKIKHKLNHLGGCMDPHAAFLLHRGMKTLALRIRQQNESALQLARMLEAHPAVSKVHYPGLESNPYHERAKELFAGFGGMLSFELGTNSPSDADRLVRAVRLPISAPSLGGVESLITRPAQTSHAGMSQEERVALGITDALIRVSVGIESTQELLDDFSQALDSLSTSNRPTYNAASV